jgi:hypothetical protein
VKRGHPKINKQFIVQTGRTCDWWNMAVEQQLRLIGNVEVLKVNAFGSHIVFVSKS